jgi:multicomponent Na+:H+ antiporter subunit D
VIAAVLMAPWVAAALLAALDGRRRCVGWIAVAALAGALLATGLLAVEVLRYGALQVVPGGWEAGVGIPLRADALSTMFLLFAQALLLVALVEEVRRGVEERAFPAVVLFLAAGLAGLFLTADVFNFYVFFEIAMTASFVLSGYGREPSEVRNQLVFTMVNLLGSVLFLTAVAGLYHVAGSLAMDEIQRNLTGAERAPRVLIGALILAAFSVKLGFFPLHYWLPPVYRGVRPVAAGILSGVLANIGSYGLVRFGVGVLPFELQLSAELLLVVGSCSVLYGAVVALTRPWAREVLAYSSISQAGYILLALGARSEAGIAAAVLFALVNGLNKMLLFLVAGRRGAAAAAAYFIGALSVTGVPPSAGFIGKAAVLRALLPQWGAVVVVVIGSVLAFIYMFRSYQRRYWRGTREPRSAAAGPMGPALVVAAAVLVLGLWPEPLLAIGRLAAAAAGEGGPP